MAYAKFLPAAGFTLSNDDLTVTLATGSWKQCFTDYPVESGKVYWEIEIVESGSANYVLVGIVDEDGSLGTGIFPGDTGDGYGYLGNNGTKFNNPDRNVSYGSTFTDGDIIGIAYDADDGSIEFFKNGVSQGVAYTGVPAGLTPSIGMYSAGSILNLVSDPANMTYAAPSGFTAGLGDGPSNNTTVTAKTVILDCLDNWGYTSFIGLRSVDFYLDGTLIELSSSDFTAYATTNNGANYLPVNVFDTSISKTGDEATHEWISASGYVSGQRLIIVLNSAIEFDSIVVNNSHHSGAYTTIGVQNVVITISTDEITDTTYGAAISNSTIIYDGTFDQHAAVDGADDQELILTLPTNSFDPSIVADSNKRTITLDSSVISSDQADFPLMLRVTDSAVFAALGDNSLKISVEQPTNITPDSQWTLDNIDGSTVIDEVENYDLTNTGMTISSGGVFDNYADSGGSSGVSLDAGSNIPFKTLCFWIKRNSTSLISCFIGLDSNHVCFINTDNLLYSFHGLGSVASDISIDDTDWHFICLREGSTNNYHEFCIDGVWGSSELLTNLGGLFRYIGRGNSVSGQENCNVDNIMRFETVLTDAQVDLIRTVGYQIVPDALQLPIEVAFWDSANSLAILYTKVDYPSGADGELIFSFDADQVDNTDYVGGVGSTVGQTVWSNGFLAVWHMNQDPTTGVLLDSTANGVDVTLSGTFDSSDLVQNAIGLHGIDFSGANYGYFTTPSELTGGGLTTIEGISLEVHLAPAACTQYGAVICLGSYDFEIAPVTSGLWGIWINDSYLSTITSTCTGDNTEKYLAATKSNNTYTFHDDGIVIGSEDDTDNVTISSDSYIAYNSAGAYFSGIIYEARLSLVSRSADWEKLTYLSLVDQLITWASAGFNPALVPDENKYKFTLPSDFVFRDDFNGTDGDAPNSLVWGGYENPSYLSMQNNALNYSNSVSAGGAYRSLFQLVGDFSVDVKINLNTVPAGATWVAYLGVSVDDLGGNDWAYIGFANLSGTKAHRGSTKINGTSDATEATTAQTTAWYRVVRSGSTITVYYKEDVDWVQIHQASGFTTADLYLILRGYTNNGLLDFDFDELIVNSGTINWPDDICPPTKLYIRENQRPNDVSDDFTGDDGDAPNSLLWSVAGTQQTPYINSNSLRFDIINSSTDQQEAESVFSMPGDCDIQTDLDVITGASTNRWVASLQLRVNDNNTLTLFRDYNSGHRVAVYSVVSGVGALKASIYTAVTSLKFRISRIGATVTVQYYTTSWITLWTGTWVDYECVVRMVLSTTTGSAQTSIVDFDNFIVNSGTINWPETHLPGSGVTGFDLSDVFTLLVSTQNARKIAILDAAETVQYNIESEVSGWDFTNEDASILVMLPPNSQGQDFVFAYDPTQDDNTDYVVDDLGYEPTYIDDLVTWGNYAGPTYVSALAYWDLTWECSTDIINYWDLLWTDVSIKVYNFYYGNAGEVIKSYNLYYWDAAETTKVYDITYGQAFEVMTTYDFEYSLVGESTKTYDFNYSLLSEVAQKYWDLTWGILAYDVAQKIYTLRYSLIGAQTFAQQIQLFFVKNGNSIPYNNLSLEADKGTYYIKGAVTVNNPRYFNLFKKHDPVSIMCQGVTYNLVVTKLPSTTTTRTAVVLQVSLGSPAVKLASREAPVLDKEFDPGWASEIAISLAALMDVEMVWNLQHDGVIVDQFISAGTLFANNEKPLDVIRKITGAMGGRLHSRPDGVLEVQHQYQTRVPDWDEVTPEVVLGDAMRLRSISSDVEEGTGVNTVVVSDQLSASDTYNLQEEDINDTQKEIRGYITPWGEKEVYLDTSGGSDVVIQYLGEFSETVPDQDDAEDYEIVEFVSGQGSVSKPIYDIVSREWLQDSLGSVTSSEDGTLVAEESGESLLGIVYKSKYKKWLVTSPTIKDVQFILRPVE